MNEYLLIYAKFLLHPITLPHHHLAVSLRVTPDRTLQALVSRRRPAQFLFGALLISFLILFHPLTWRSFSLVPTHYAFI